MCDESGGFLLEACYHRLESEMPIRDDKLQTHSPSYIVGRALRQEGYRGGGGLDRFLGEMGDGNWEGEGMGACPYLRSSSI